MDHLKLPNPTNFCQPRLLLRLGITLTALVATFVISEADGFGQERIETKIGGTAEGIFFGGEIGYGRSLDASSEVGAYAAVAKGHFNDKRTIEAQRVRTGLAVPAQSHELGVGGKYFFAKHIYIGGGIGYQHLDGQSDSYLTDGPGYLKNHFIFSSMYLRSQVGMRLAFSKEVELGLEVLEARLPFFSKLDITGDSEGLDNNEYVLEPLKDPRIGLFPKVTASYRF